MKKEKTQIGRNEPCPCGSGLKYKKCCMAKDTAAKDELGRLKTLYYRKYQIRLKTEAEIAGIRKAGELVAETLAMVAEKIRPGMTTDEINTLVHAYTVEHGAIPAPLNYRGFPKSTCVSINEVICHGIPGNRVMEDGDIVNVDVTSILNGFYADSNRTFFVGTPGPDAEKIVRIAYESLEEGLAMVRPGNRLGDVGWAIQKHAEASGCSVVREFVGHGTGIDFHEPPQVLHFGKRGTGVPFVPGMVFTIEPMVNLGAKELVILEDDWTAITADGSLSAQFEQTIVVTNDGYETLTPFL